ncbi:MAG: hypothetical protein NZ700_00545 [Gemmataceae bacterium]|nr:hypothetical protein [Gemmataceae bacterium]MDW8264490.1 hypothetical protein [Gemmataceae bacterium]
MPPPTAANQVANAADGYGIVAWAAVSADVAQVALLRQRPSLSPRLPLPANFLKFADEQTVVAMAAVRQAIAAHLQETDFSAWGVLAAPSGLGRLGSTAALHRVRQKGYQLASPMLIPHQSLHSVSATIGMALGSRGPNYGISGDAAHLVEGLVTLLAAMDDHPLAGWWLVLTGWDPEPALDESGQCLTPGDCHALALAFVPVPAPWPGLRLRYRPGRSPISAAVPRLRDLMQLLTAAAAAQRPCRWSAAVNGCGLVELEGVAGCPAPLAVTQAARAA